MKTNSLDFDAQALREKILDLAMRGKLVKQDPNDEPASVLLEKIKADTTNKLSAKKTKKIKIESHSGEENLKYKIPDNWTWTKIGYLIYKLSDGAHKTPRYTSTGVPFLSVKDMSRGQIDFDNCKYISEKDHEILYKRCDPKKGDILLSKVGTTGVPALVDTEKKFDLFVSVALLKFNNNYVDPLYLKYLIESPIVQIQAKRNTRGVGNKNWVLRDIAGTVVPLPPLSEQKRIAAKIAQLFDLLRKIESSTQQYAKLQTLLKSKVLDLAMRGKLVEQDPNDKPASVLLEKIKAEKEQLIKEKKIKKSKPLPPISDEEKPFEIPDSWEWVYVKDITTIGSFKSVSPQNINQGENLIELADIEGNTGRLLNFEKVTSKVGSNKYRYNQGDVLFAKLRPYLRKVLIAPNNGICTTELLPITGVQTNNTYIYYIFLSDFFFDQISQEMHGVNLPRISPKKLSELIIPLPPIDEQSRIVADIRKLFVLLSKVQEGKKMVK